MGSPGAPTTLMAGELAFSERDLVLYYGSGSDGGGQAQVIIPIAGEGAFLPSNPDTGDGYVITVSATAGTGISAVTTAGNVVLAGIDATTTVKGVVKFATTEEITNGTPGVVPDAAQLLSNKYVLPVATADVLGGIKVGDGLAITGDGELSTNITGGVVYMGETDVTGVAPASVAGHQYLNTVEGTADGSWTGIAGETVSDGVMVISDGSEWAVISGGSSGVVSVTGTEPITVDTSTNGADQPIIGIATGTEAKVGALRLATDAEVQGKASGVAVQPSQLAEQIDNLEPLPEGTQAGDIMQWDPSENAGSGGWVVSNVLEGGTF